MFLPIKKRTNDCNVYVSFFFLFFLQNVYVSLGCARWGSQLQLGGVPVIWTCSVHFTLVRPWERTPSQLSDIQDTFHLFMSLGMCEDLYVGSVTKNPVIRHSLVLLTLQLPTHLKFTCQSFKNIFKVPLALLIGFYLQNKISNT